METVVSGIRPTGNLHLGNYFGALNSFIQMQSEYQCYFFIADWHSLTTHPNPVNIRNSVKTILSEYLACGIDPEKATIYIQSDVHEVAELYLYLNMNAYMGELAKTPTFKEKLRKQPDNINTGLLTYPVLQAADILIHNANKVPVGKDQEQHIELARKFARRFNTIYEIDFFIEPKSYHFSEKSVKVPGLDGTGKMGKSEGNAIYLIDDEDTIQKKVMRAITDSGPTIPNSEKPEAIQNLFTMMQIVSSKDTYKYYSEKYNNCEIRYGDMKKQLAYDINNFCDPIRKRINEIGSDNVFLEKIAQIGAEKASANAAKTLNEVRKIIGFKST